MSSGSGNAIRPLGPLPKRASKLMKAFGFAKSAKSKLKSFQQLEKLIDDERLLALACWQLAEKLSDEGDDPEKILCFGKRALKTLIDISNEISHSKLVTSSLYEVVNTGKSLMISSLLTVMGLACFELRRFDESLSYFNWCDRNLRKLEADQSVPAQLVLPKLFANQGHLCKVKVVMGRTEELIVHAKKIVEIKEKVLGEDCMELGKLYADFSGDCIVVGKYKEALPYCLKAVEIHVKHLGESSVEVARVRRNLGVIYSGLEEYEKAIEQNQLAQSVLKKDEGSGEVLIKAKLENADMLVHMGRYQEAVDVLKGVVSDVADNESQLAVAFVSMAKAFYGLEKFADAKTYMELSLRIFDKEGMDFGIVSAGLGDIAYLYEDMEDFGNAISVALRMLKMTKMPQEILREYSTRHAELTELMRKEKADEGEGPSEEDTLDEAFALLELIKENLGGLTEKPPTTAAPQPRYEEDFPAQDTESIISKDRKPSSSH